MKAARRDRLSPRYGIKMMQMRFLNVIEGARVIALALLVVAGTTTAPAWSQIPDVATGRIPTLAPLVREVTPAVVNISVQGKVREDNPLYKDPFFREFFDMPKQLEKEVKASGSGVIVDAQRGYILTANPAVAQ